MLGSNPTLVVKGLIEPGFKTSLNSMYLVRLFHCSLKQTVTKHIKFKLVLKPGFEPFYPLG